MNLPDLPAEPLETTALQQIVELGDGDLSLLHEMIGIFREDTPPRLEALRLALDAGRAEDLSAEAHALKGAAGTMGAQRMRVLAFALEQAGRVGMAGSDERVIFEQLMAAYPEALDALEDYARRQAEHPGS